MARMKCIGAQNVDLTDLTAPTQGLEMPCRRTTGQAEYRTFVSAVQPDTVLAESLQLSLFEPALDCAIR